MEGFEKEGEDFLYFFFFDFFIIFSDMFVYDKLMDSMDSLEFQEDVTFKKKKKNRLKKEDKDKKERGEGEQIQIKVSICVCCLIED